jgi:hypothetical protein
VRTTGVSGRFACGFRTDLHFADDTTRCVDSACMVLLGAGVLRLLVPSVAVGVIIDRRCFAARVEVTL